MYYFIPFLENTDHPWMVNIVPWYRTPHRLEFDDVLHQLRIFKHQNIDSKVILLAYHPHARYFLHRQDMFEMDTFSVFDAIQNINNEEMIPLQLKDLSWEEDCDFIYTPFLIVVKRKGQRYAHIEFGSEGFISDITYFKNDQIQLICYFDDRGFLSSLVEYQDQLPAVRYFYNAKGEWQIRENLQEGSPKIEVNPKVSGRFLKQSYQSMDEVVWEFFNKFLDQTYQKGDVFVLAAQTRYQDSLLQQLPEEAPKILSFFTERNYMDDLQLHQRAIEASHFLISDRKDFLEKLQYSYPQFVNKMHHLPSFDTRLKLGLSQRLSESKIYVQIDLDIQLDPNVLCEILAFVSKNHATEVTFAVFNAEEYQIESLKEQLDLIISEQLDIRSLLKESVITDAENILEENKKDNFRFQILNLNDEIDLIREFEFTRLIVDLNPSPNIYTQIAGISAGIPQINLTESEYVTHLGNGYILSEVSEFDKAAHYFLDTLHNWNKALIHSIDKIRENTGDQFVRKWEKWIEEGKIE